MDAAANSPTERPLAGIVLVVVGLFFFSIQDVVIKQFSDTYSVLQIVFVRGVVTLLVILPVLRVVCGWRGLRTTKPLLLLARGFFAFAAYLTYYMAIVALPLAEAATLVFLAPILVTMMSALLLKEPVGLRRWVALLVGFAAIILVIGPSGDFRHLATLLALGTAVTYACSTVITRLIGGTDHPWTITLYSTIAFLIGSIGVGALVMLVDASAADPSLQFLLRAWVLPTPRDSLLMLFLGANAALAFFCIIKAYWLAQASVVAPFEYTYLIWAVLFGYLFWGEIPQAWNIVGVTLLVASSLYIFRRELHLLRRPPKQKWRVQRG